MRLDRSAGVLLHPTSLPSGRLGRDAHSFVDWLADAGQSWWQVLPLGPPDEHSSPYRAESAFAASPALVDDPDARVSGAERDAFRRKHAFWVEPWIQFAGDGAIDDQVRFDREWAAVRAHAERRGVRILGDVPIYVAPGGCDHRAHPELFLEGFVAGAPPDAFSATGQHWGNPLYDWPALQRRRYRWWTERLRRTLDLHDAARIDHFRGFVAAWAIPEEAGTHAERGRWRRGPGAAPFHAMSAALGRDLPLVAENLGVITAPVERLRHALGLPGMVVLQFGFDPDDPDGPHRLSNHEEQAVVYTGTHDHDTIAGWWAGAGPDVRAAAEQAIAAAGVGEPEPHWSLIRLTLSSRARLAIVQTQDVLGLGSEARMNFPGIEGGRNWRWRLEPGQLDRALARRLRKATESAER